MDLGYSDEETTKDKDKGKEKVGEKKEKEHAGEKNKASQEDQLPHKRRKSKSHKPTSDVQLGMDNYDNITTQVQESLEPPMTMLVTSETTMKRALDMQIAELRSIVERGSQLTTQEPSSWGSP